MKNVELDSSVFEHLFNNAVAGMALLSFDGHWLKVNASLSEMLGYRVDEMLGMTSLASLYPDDIEEHLKVVAQFAKRVRESYQGEKRFIHKSGRIIWVHSYTSLIRNENGDPKYFVAQILDITRRKESEEISKIVMESTIDGFWDWHLQRDYQYMSPRFWEMLGHDAKEKTHQPSEWKRCIYPDDLGEVMSNLTKHIESHGGEPFHQEVRFLHKNGSTIWAIYKGKVIKWGAQGEAVRMVGTLTDTSALKSAQSALIQNDKMVALGQMAGGIAHEINTPLATIELNVGTIEEALARANIKNELLDNCLLRVHGTVRAIGGIVESLRRFSRDSSLVDFEIQPVTQIVDDTLALCQEKLRHSGVTLKTDIPSFLNVECKGVEIVQVILNLVSNAFHAIENQEQKEITIQAWQNLGYVYISVSDNGGGIPQAIRNKIMEPYFTTKPVGKGTGLGLSICNTLIEAHGGRFYLDETSCKTRFCIELPEKRILNVS